MGLDLLNDLGASKVKEIAVGHTGSILDKESLYTNLAKVKGMYNINLVVDGKVTQLDFKSSIQSFLNRNFSLTKDATFYKNFPHNVPSNLSILYLNEFFHYLTKSVDPLIPVNNYKEIDETDEIKAFKDNLLAAPLATIKVVSVDKLALDLYNYYTNTNLMVSKDEMKVFKEIVSHIVVSLPDVELKQPKLATLKAIQNSVVYSNIPDNMHAFTAISKAVSSPSDVLRFAAELSSEFSSDDLGVIKRFKLTTHQKKMVVALLTYVAAKEKSIYFETDIASHIEQWKTLAKITQQYPNKGVKKAWIAIADNLFEGNYRSASSMIEAAISEDSNKESYTEVLKEFPGLALRSLYVAVKRGKLNIVESFETLASVINKAPNKIKVQLYNRAAEIATKVPARFAKVKGKYQLIERDKDFDNKKVMAVIDKIKKLLLASLKKDFDNKKPDLKAGVKTAFDANEPKYDLALATSSRQSSSSIINMGSFSGHSLGSHKYIRPLIHWTNDVDIDLSAMFYDNKGGFVERIAYTDLRCSFAYHSGDITRIPENGEAVESIWVNVKKALECGAKYMLTSAIVYDGYGNNFSKLDVTYGIAVHDNSQVSHKSTQGLLNSTSSSANSTVIMCDLINLETMENIHLDIPFNTEWYGNNTYSTGKEAGSIVKLLLEMNSSYLKLSDLFTSNSSELLSYLQHNVVVQQQTINDFLN